jgi:hypothetical protein
MPEAYSAEYAGHILAGFIPFTPLIPVDQDAA